MASTPAPCCSAPPAKPRCGAWPVPMRRRWTTRRRSIWPIPRCTAASCSSASGWPRRCRRKPLPHWPPAPQARTMCCCSVAMASPASRPGCSPGRARTGPAWARRCIGTHPPSRTDLSTAWPPAKAATSRSCHRCARPCWGSTASCWNAPTTHSRRSSPSNWQWPRIGNRWGCSRTWCWAIRWANSPPPLLPGTTRPRR